MNLKQTIKDISGKDLPKSFPKTEDEAKMPETVDNVILNSLVAYPVKDKKEIFKINRIANLILEANEKTGGIILFSDENKKLLEDVLWEATNKKIGEENKGFYLPMVIVQILKELEVEY